MCCLLLEAMKKLTSCFLFCLVVSLNALASVPEIVNFSTKTYKSHPINYCFTQDTAGVMFIGNAYGILEYDGQSWRKIALVDGKSALSMDVDVNGRIYIGSSAEFGYLQKTAAGINEYVSLKAKLPKEDINEILNLICIDNTVYFRSLYAVYQYKNNKITKLTPLDKSQLIYFIDKQQEKILAAKLGKGIIQVAPGKPQKIASFLSNDQVRGILHFQNETTIYLTDQKIFFPDHPELYHQANEQIGKANITCGLKINETEFLIGTVNKGIFHLNVEGELISNFNKNSGLQNNFIRDLFLDRSGNIWLAYNSGIGLLKWNSSIRYIPPSMGIRGMGYCALVKGDTLFAGTSSGLYYLPHWQRSLKQQKNFTKVKGIDGMINDLNLANGKIIACQKAEVFQLSKGSAIRISNGEWFGAWKWKNNPNRQNQAFVGTNIGLSNYTFSENQWVFQNQIKGFRESSRVFEVDKQGVLWTVQGNKGLFRVQLNEQGDSAISVTNYINLMHLNRQDYFNDIFTFHDSLIVTSYGGTYLVQQDSLILLKSFSKLKSRANRIRKYNEDGLYAIYDDQAHLLKQVSGHWEVNQTPVSFLKSYLVGSAEFFYEVSDQTCFIGTQDGFATFSVNDQEVIQKTPCLIRGIELLNPAGDSLLFSNKPAANQVFSYAHNNIKISYTLPLYGNKKQILYETRLFKNGDEVHNWKKAYAVNFKEYTNLREGKYLFEVRAQVGDQLAGDTSLSFTISPPWYRTNFMKTVYFLSAFACVFLVIKLFKRQKRKLEIQNRKELEIKERLYEGEKLATALKTKEKELAYLALTYTQKKDLLARLTSQLNKISKDLSHADQIKFRPVESAISSNLDDESNWENFQLHFDEKNDNFFKKLKQKHGKMNESYLLFCSYVRMGKSNKEIADLLNISVAAVEKRKYRMKKKWDLPEQTSFTEYLNNL